MRGWSAGRGQGWDVRHRAAGEAGKPGSGRRSPLRPHGEQRCKQVRPRPVSGILPGCVDGVLLELDFGGRTPPSFLGTALCGGDCRPGAPWGESGARRPDAAVAAGLRQVAAPPHPEEQGDPIPAWGAGECGTSFGSGRAPVASSPCALCPQLLDGLWEDVFGSRWKRFLPPLALRWGHSRGVACPRSSGWRPAPPTPCARYAPRWAPVWCMLGGPAPGT